MVRKTNGVVNNRRLYGKPKHRDTQENDTIQCTQQATKILSNATTMEEVQSNNTMAKDMAELKE
jgi:hypothetical protein